MRFGLQWTNRIRTATVVLGLLVLLGLLLRLWGLNWPGQTPAETQTVKIIAGLAAGDPSLLTQIGWQQAFSLIAVLLYLPVQWVLGLAGQLLGPAGHSALAVPPLLWARVVAACLGALNIWALYRLCLLLLQSRTAALLAAGLLAVNPWSLAQGHLGTSASATALAVTLALWAGLKFYQRQRLLDYFWAGLASGLAICLGPAGWLLLPCLLLAQLVLLLWWQRPAWWRWLLARPGAFLGGLALGLSPAWLIWWLAGPLESSAPTASTWSDRLAWSLQNISQAVGWELILLYAAGLGLVVWQRRRGVWPLAAYSLLAGLFVLFANGDSYGDYLTALLPPLLCLAMYLPLWAMSRGLPRGLRPWLWAALGLVLIITPLGRSIEAGYVFWQSDTRAAARSWLATNLPPGAKLFADPFGLLPKQSMGNALPAKGLSGLQGPDKFMVLSAWSLAGAFSPWNNQPRTDQGQLARQLEKDFLLLKQFDLKPGTAGLALAAPRFPAMVSPLLRVYAARPKLAIQQPLGLSHPPVRSAQPHLVSYGNHSVYSLDDAVALISGPGRATRVLRTNRDLVGVEVELISLATWPLTVELSQGPGTKRRLQLPAGQRVVQSFEPTPWPWPMQRVYPFACRVEGQGQVFMRLLSDPLLLGRRCLERGQWQRAAAYLEQARLEHPRALLPRALLAAARLKLGKNGQAAALLQDQEQGLEALAALVLGNLPRQEWLARLAQFSGLYPDLLQNALGKTFRPGPAGLGDGNGQSRAGYGFSLQTGRGGEGKGHKLRLRLQDPWPVGRARARFILSWHGSPAENAELLGTLEAVAYSAGGWRVVAQKMLTPKALAKKDGRGSFELRLAALLPGERWEFVLRSFGGTEIRLQEVRLALDPKDDLSRGARWAFWAQGASMLAQGRPGPAVVILEWLRRLDADFMPGIISHTEALFATGQKRAARKRLQKALSTLEGRREGLAWGVAMLKKLGDEKLLQQYQQALAQSQARVRDDVPRP